MKKALICIIQWNIDLMKCQWTGEICLLYQRFVTYIEMLVITNLRKNNQRVRYIEVLLTEMTRDREGKLD